METQRLRRRRSRRKARKKQVVWLTAFALVIGIIVWTRILIERRHDQFIASADATAPTSEAPDTAVKPAGAGANAAKNLILFIGNGYGIVPMTATRIYAVGEKGELAIDRLPQTALVRTSSRNAQSADDAAAMSAYMTGVKVNNGVLSQTADTRPYDENGLPHATHGETTCPTAGNGARAVTLLELAKASGRAAGIVTTARVTESTTAASFAHLCNRGAENSIAGQLVPGGPDANRQLGEGIDVVLGGGWQNFLPKDDPRGSSRSDTRDLFAEMRARGYTVIGRQIELAALGRGAQAGAQSDAQPVGKLIGLFNRSRMNFDIDRAGTTEPSLAEMTTRAIDLLQRNPAGYLLIVEGGRIGDAFDRSQARKGLHEGRAFDDAINAAIEQVRALDPELRNTVIVVTANHDHTLVMNGNSALVGRTSEIRPGILGVVHAYDQPSQIAVDASGRPYTTLVFGTGEKRVKGPRSAAPAISDLVLGERDSRYEAAVEVSEATGGADVMLGAVGQYADRFHGTLENTQVFSLLREALGL